MWSPWNLPGAQGGIHKKVKVNDPKRDLYSHDDYVDLVLDSGRPLTHEYEGGSVDEDPRMLAFFDTLIQREHGGWNSESDSTYSEDDFYSNFLVRSSDGSGSDSDRVSAQRVRDILSMETRDSDESDETSQAVLRRMRRLRRAAFLRGLVRGSERQNEEEVDESQSHPSDSQNAFLRHLTREIMREALESSSDSSDSEPTVTLEIPEEFLDNDNTEETTEPVEFNHSRSHRVRQYRRRSSSRESTPPASTENGNINSNEIDISTRTRRREPSSSSSEEDSHEDECRISQLNVRRTKRRRTKLENSDCEQIQEPISNNNVIDQPSTSCSSGNSLNPPQEGRNSERLSNLNDGRSNSRHVQNNETSTLQLNEEPVNHNGHRIDGHNNHNVTTHFPDEEKDISLENKKKI